MVKLHCNRNGKKLTLEACTETYFMAGLSKLRQGVEFREAFKGLRVAERDKLFHYLHFGA